MKFMDKLVLGEFVDLVRPRERLSQRCRTQNDQLLTLDNDHSMF